MTRTQRSAVLVLLLFVTGSGSRVAAHSGPPFPIESDRLAGPYRVSIWTDPDTTDDGTPGGQFWVMIAPRDPTVTLPPGTAARVAAASADRPGDAAPVSASASPVRGDPSTQFAALLFEHEGPYQVHVQITGPLGEASVDSQVMATFDLRPAPVLLLVYLLPFVLVGLLWMKRLVSRRRAAIESLPAGKP